MRTTMIMLALATVAGGILGGIFFGGLWWTTRAGLSARQPAVWFFVSMLVRTAIALAGFYVVGAGAPGRLLTCLLGFVIAHIAIAWWSQLPGGGSVGHAP